MEEVPRRLNNNENDGAEVNDDINMTIPENNDLHLILDAGTKGGSRVTRYHFEEYKRGCSGIDESSAYEFLRHWQLHSAISEVMTAQELAKYSKAIHFIKNREDNVSDEDIAKAEGEIAELELKVLDCPGFTNQQQQERAQSEQEKPSKRVKIVATGKKGTMQSSDGPAKLSTEALYRVTLDKSGDNTNKDKESSSSDDTVMCELTDLIFLCDVCDQDAGKKCSRCKSAYYCSLDCQKQAWKQHKKVCTAHKSKKGHQ